MAFPEPLREELVDQIVRRVFHHLDLLDDHLLLPLDILGIEGRVEDDVGEHVERQRQMLVEHLDVVAGVLFGGEGVELAANRVDLLGDVLGGPGPSPLEQHVLDEVGNAATFGGLVPRTAGQPDTNADRPNLIHRLGQNPEAVIEYVADDR